MVYPEDVVIECTKRKYTMTYENDYTIPEEIMEQICEQGFDASKFKK